MMPPERLQKVLERIDHLNRQDPRKTHHLNHSEPLEWVHAQHMKRWITKLSPQGSEFLYIAAYGQHIERWTIPRETYPMNRAGYLRWREDLKKHHAKTVTDMMNDVGYTQEEQDKTRTLILKKEIKTDPEAQNLEDALCLVFLETQFQDFKLKTPPEKLRRILQKTWHKMSEQGQQEALKLSWTPEDEAFIKAALASDSETSH